MDKLEKLLNKVSFADRDRILKTMRLVEDGVLIGLDVKKIKGAQFFRVRVGRYRVFFCWDIKTKQNAIVAVRRRDENTY